MRRFAWTCCRARARGSAHADDRGMQSVTRAKPGAPCFDVPDDERAAGAPVLGLLGPDGRVQVGRQGVLALTGMSESRLKRNERAWRLSTTVHDGRGKLLYFVDELVALKLCTSAAAAAVVVPGVSSVLDSALELRARNDELRDAVYSLRSRVGELEVELRLVREALAEKKSELSERKADVERLRRVVDAMAGLRS